MNLRFLLACSSALCALTNSYAADSLPLAQPKSIDMEWAEMNGTPTGNTDSDRAWTSYWHNRAGAIASEVVVTKLAKEAPTNDQPLTPPPPPPPPADPNAAFRAAATPEENLARVPTVKLRTQSDYIRHLREGESAGLSVDEKMYALVRQYEDHQPTSTVPVFPPVYGPGWGGGWNGYGWGGGGWGGPVGWTGGWWGHGHSHWNHAPVVYAPPVYYNPYRCGGISGGFFYRGGNVRVGIGFSF